MKKLYLVAGAGILTALLAWYLFIKSHDYRVSFVVNTFPGTVNQTIKSWNATLGNARILSQESLLELTQELIIKDSVHQYLWEITPLTDSTSQVRVYASDRKHSLKNRLLIPFCDTDFEKRTRKTLLDFNKMLQQHLAEFEVKITGYTEIRGTYCACTTVVGNQFDKARGMMYNTPLLASVLMDNNIPLNGPPFLEITSWNMDTDSISYDFCYPIIRTDSLPVSKDLHYREFYPRRALKAIYHGNYITSDRAWYALLNYARANNTAVTGLPVEVFVSNPNMGGNELNWTAEIYLPLKD